MVLVWKGDTQNGGRHSAYLSTTFVVIEVMDNTIDERSETITDGTQDLVLISRKNHGAALALIAMSTTAVESGSPEGQESAIRCNEQAFELLIPEKNGQAIQ